MPMSRGRRRQERVAHGSSFDEVGILGAVYTTDIVPHGEPDCAGIRLVLDYGLPGVISAKGSAWFHSRNTGSERGITMSGEMRGSYLGMRLVHGDDPKVPIQARRGLSRLATSWGLRNRNGKNIINVSQGEKAAKSDEYGGIRLCCSVVTTEGRQG